MSDSSNKKINYRLYIDESGTHNYTNSDTVKGKYLCLIGTIIEKKHNENFFTPEWEKIREIITKDVDFPVMFHYTDIVARKGDFGVLRNSEIESNFNSEYLKFIRQADFTVCVVVLDKKTHLTRYGDSAMHPYHYCLNVLLERYIKFLNINSATGDVIVEARGKKEDKLLRAEFENFYQNGTYFMPAPLVQKCLTSSKLKLKNKQAMIAGLEFTDMIGTPLKFLTLKKYGVIGELDNNFSLKVLKEVYPKIRTNEYGKIKGVGMKLID